MNSEFYITTELKERGWTDFLIRKLLGAPDASRPNPRFASAAPMRLYLRERVVAAEQSEQWAALAASVDRRRAGSQRAAETKTARLLAYVDGMDIQVPVLPMPDVLQSACNNYDDLQEEKAFRRGFYDWKGATPDSDAVFLERITVNYLRHEFSHYDAELKRIFGRVEVNEAYVHLNNKVYAAIAAAYPDLASECERQAEGKGGRGAMDRASADGGDPDGPTR